MDKFNERQLAIRRAMIVIIAILWILGVWFVADASTVPSEAHSGVLSSSALPAATTTPGGGTIPPMRYYMPVVLYNLSSGEHPPQ